MYILPEQVLPTYINYNKAPPQNLSDKLSNGITYIQPIIKDNISIKEKEINDLPSNKMILYATDICRNLKINLPDQLTKEAYKDFISKYKDDNLKNLKNSYSKDYDEREDINYYGEDEVF